MRHLILSDDGYHVAGNAYHRLLAISHFPESPRDQEQGLFIAAMEQAEFDRVGQENYQPSEITQAASRLLEKRTAQLYLVGFVAISYTWLKAQEHTPSLNRASIIASCAANEFGKIRWAPSLNLSNSEKVTPVTSDPSTVERIFRKYRSVAHIWAASVAASEYLEPVHLWDRPPEVVSTIIKTCAAFQTTLENSTDTSAWNLWDVTKHFPKSLGDWPILFPGAELLDWIATGHAMAIDQGLIKR